jgi:hypothetical protein
MRLSRRSLGRNCIAMLTATMVPQGLWAALGEAFRPFSSAQPTGSPGPPKMVVEEFSKAFDPAYLSNGLIGIRPGPNPLARAQTCVSGFVFAHTAHRVESLSPAPYPLETDVRAKGVSLLKHPDLLKVKRQTLDMSCGELFTELTFAPSSSVRLDIEVVQFASRSVPSLLCQEIQITPSADTEVELVAIIGRGAMPGRANLPEPP